MSEGWAARLLLLTLIFATTHGDEWRCGKLAGALEGFSKMIDLYWGGMPFTSFQMDQMSAHLGYQLDSPEGFHRFACAIVDSPNLEGLAETTGIPAFRLEHHYGFLERVVNDYGGWNTFIYKREALQFLYTHVIDWYNVTGFPSVPVNTTFSDAVVFLTGVENMMGKETIDEAFALVDYLSRVSVKDSAKAMVESTSADELRTNLNLENFEWDYLQNGGLMRDYERYISAPGNADKVIAFAYHMQILPYDNSGEVTLPSPPPECAAVFDVFVGAVRESKNHLHYISLLLDAASLLNIDVFDPEALTQLACDVAACESLADLADLLGFTQDVMEGLQRDFVRSVEWCYNSREGLLWTIDLIERIEDFCDLSGYPIFPLYDVTTDDVTEFFSDFQMVTDVIPGIARRLISEYFPVDRYPAVTLAEAFMGASDIDEAYAGLHRSPPTAHGLAYFRPRLAKERRRAELALHATDVATGLGLMEPF